MTSYSEFSAVYQFETTETPLCEMKMPRLTFSGYTRLAKTIKSNFVLLGEGFQREVRWTEQWVLQAFNGLHVQRRWGVIPNVKNNFIKQ